MLLARQDYPVQPPRYAASLCYVWQKWCGYHQKNRLLDLSAALTCNLYCQTCCAGRSHGLICDDLLDSWERVVGGHWSSCSQCPTSKMTLPNFLIVGAAKSGTTALYQYLKQHPQVYMSSRKESNFFAFEGQEVDFCGPGDEWISESTITTLEAYEKQFEAATSQKAIGEASPWYLYSARAAQKIHRYIPSAKLIAILRNPANRAFSSYLHVVRDSRERLPFEEGLLAEEARVAQGWEYIWHYRRAGFYSSQVKLYLDLFPREQMRFYLYDDFSSDPTSVLRDIYEFLDVDTDFVADMSIKPNTTGVPSNQLLGRLLLQPNLLRSAVKVLLPAQLSYNVAQRINQRLLKKPSLDQQTYGQLLSGFEDDVYALQDLIGCDLSPWLSESIAGEPSAKEYRPHAAKRDPATKCT
jgi:hypothetical protein